MFKNRFMIKHIHIDELMSKLFLFAKICVTMILSLISLIYFKDLIKDDE